jgi:tetratricopeptide (TPR) repeat protein
VSVSTELIACRLNKCDKCIRFSDMFWIDASSESSLELALMQIAQANNTSQEAKPSATSALQWISKRANWLIVYDSADGHYSVVEKFLPPGNGGNVLITSRNPGLKRMTLDKNSLEVLDMTNEEGISLLLKSAMLDGTSEHIMTMARKLVAELGGIPLAIDQAGGYMLSCGCSMNDYLELYTKHRDKLMSNPEFKGATGYDTNTYGTWEIAMQKIENMAAKDTGEQALAAHNAIKLFRIFAFLDHENIPQQLFKNAAGNYMERNDKWSDYGLPLSVKLLDYETLFLNEEGVWDIIQFLSGIQVLLSFSLIKSHYQQYSMHLLVHAWSRSRLPKADITDLYHRTRAVLSCSIVLDYNNDNYKWCRSLVPHIRSSSLHAIGLKLHSTFYDDEYSRFSLVFHHVGDWNEREKLLVVQVNQRKTKFGSDHPHTLYSMCNLALTYYCQGKWGEAEKLQIEVMNAREAKLGSDHPDTFTSRRELSLTYERQGRWDDSEKLQIEVMNARQAKLGSDHPETLASRRDLAWTYQCQGRWDEAEKLQIEVMNAREAKLGSDHPWTLTSRNDLAWTYQSQGRWDEAEKLQIEVMNAREAKLGSDHPDTLTSGKDLAWTYQSQGRWDEAEKLQIEVMNGRQAKLGYDHPDTLTSMGDLAVTYKKQGRWDEAEELEVGVMGVRQAKLSSDHPDTLIAMNNLASTYRNQRRWDEAEKLQVQVMNARQAKFGSEHPLTLTSKANLALTYWGQGRLDEAHSLLSHAVEMMPQVMGPQHPTTVQHVKNLDNLSTELLVCHGICASTFI